jgi:hypothetical protein
VAEQAAYAFLLKDPNSHKPRKFDARPADFAGKIEKLVTTPTRRK